MKLFGFGEAMLLWLVFKDGAVLIQAVFLHEELELGDCVALSVALV